MRVYRISKCKYINDLSGYGAFLEGGRWNSAGHEMLYTSQSIALSMLEVLVHLPASLAPNDFCLLTLEIPDNDIEQISKDELPNDWNTYPGSRSTQRIGDLFLQKQRTLVLQVPSSVIEQEFNYLLNPLHPAFKQKVKVVASENIRIDRRLNP